MKRLGASLAIHVAAALPERDHEHARHAIQDHRHTLGVHDVPRALDEVHLTVRPVAVVIELARATEGRPRPYVVPSEVSGQHRQVRRSLQQSALDRH